MDASQFSRVLLKLSGESLKGERDCGYSPSAIDAAVESISRIIGRGVELAVVVGAGNIWRGSGSGAERMDRVNADYMGMLATVMNAICLCDHLNSAGIAAVVQSAIAMGPVVARYDRRAALEALEAGKVVIFAGGTGSPFFTTDTTAALRALETDCEALLKATKVDGVYSADPMKYPDAERFSEISFDDALSMNLKVLDSTAFSMCRDNNLPILVFDFADGDALDRILRGDTTAGTIVR